MKKTKINAAHLCANYDVGKCRGIIITSSLHQAIDEDMAGKKGNPEKCDYFNKIVLPTLKNGG